MGNKLEVPKITFHCKITDTFDMYNFLDAFYALHVVYNWLFYEI